MGLCAQRQLGVGIERVLAGLRETITHDDQLLVAASAIFDGLLAGFVKEEQPNE